MASKMELAEQIVRIVQHGHGPNCGCEICRLLVKFLETPDAPVPAELPVEVRELIEAVREWSAGILDHRKRNFSRTLPHTTALLDKFDAYERTTKFYDFKTAWQIAHEPGSTAEFETPDREHIENSTCDRVKFRAHNMLGVWRRVR